MQTLSLILPYSLEELDVSRLAGALEEQSFSSSAARLRHNDDRADWCVNWVLEHDRPVVFSEVSALITDRAAVHNITVPLLQDQDWSLEPIDQNVNWLEQVYQDFPPFTLAPFFIHGSHYDGDEPDDLFPLKIDAATAFGSGEHGTTKGCLQALAALKDDGVCPWNVLDMGTGSGILAIAAWRLWQTPILAADIDPESIRVTQRHLQLNDVRDHKSAVQALVSDGFAQGEINARAPYDLVIANILAAPLIDMAADLCAVLDEGAYVVLSGLLNTQSDDVLAAYAGAQGLIEAQRFVNGDWTTLILRKN